MSEFFKGIPKIRYEGKDSDNPLAFKYYNPDEVVGDKTMREHLKFSVAYWHTFTAGGVDPFGAATYIRPWDSVTDPMDKAKARVEAAFEFFEKLGTEYFCFHDRDIAPEGDTLAETNLMEFIPNCNKATAHNHCFFTIRNKFHDADGILGGQAALGHGKPVQQSPVCPRRFHFLQRRCFCLFLRTGEKSHGNHL